MLRTKEEFNEFYKHHEDPWYLSWRGLQQVRYDQYVKMLSSVLSPGLSLLDIGCGRGYFIKKLWDTGYFSYIEGVDISNEAIDQAIKLFEKYTKIHFRTQQLPHVFYGEKQFDIVVTLEVIYYLESIADRKLAFLNIVNLIKDKGHALISVNISEECFSEKEFFNCLKSVGLDIKKTEYISDSAYIKYEAKLCWMYDCLKELKERSWFLYPFFYVTQKLTKFVLSSKWIARFFMYSTQWSKKGPLILCVLVKKNIICDE